ncbi:MAG TPA: YfhO family protein [Bacteroidales bacterium]|nr:YfhO family protein [Bacteroidales bacterium]
MRSSNLFKSALPHLAAVAIFLVITVVYFYPVLEGKVLHTNDSTQARDAAKEITDFRVKYGSEPLWTNAMFSGMPAYMISVKFTGNIIRSADTLLKIMKLPIASIFLTMLGFYILLLIFRVKPWLAIGGAIAYGLSTYFFFILTAGHNTKAIAIAYMAPMIGSIYYTYRFDILKGALLTTFFLALELIANHPQITYYSFLCVLVLVIAEFIWAIRQKEIRKFLIRSAVMVIPVLLAVGMNFGSLYTTWEYGKFSNRGGSNIVTENKGRTKGLDFEYATHWSYGIDETMTLLIPNFKGGSSKPFDLSSGTVTALRQNNAGQYASGFYQYWGTQPWTDGPVYVGAIICFLFVLGLFIIKGPEKWWLLAATVLSIMLAWGKNFMPLTSFFMNHFPGYNKFRAVTMTLVIAEFCMPLLGILALREIFEGRTDRKVLLKGIKIALGITGGLSLIFILVPGLSGNFSSRYDPGQLPDWLSSALKADRMRLLRLDALRSLVFILMACGVLLGFFYEKVGKNAAIAILGLLFLIDMFSVDKRYLNSDNFVNNTTIRKLETPSLADSRILADKSYHRVLNLSVSVFNDASTSFFHKSIGGYNGAKLRRYEEITDSIINNDLIGYQAARQTARTMADLMPSLERLSNNNAMRMLNAKYFIIDPNMEPYTNTKALGNAWFADSAVFAPNGNEELSLTARIDPGKIAAVSGEFRNIVRSSSFRHQPGDSVSLESYRANELVYSYNASGERLIVFSEIWYPAGWKAFIDGKKASYIRANWTLRGMVVPAGRHEIRFSFEPDSYYTGNKISFASSALFLILLAGFIAREFLGRKKTGQNVAS